MESTADNGLGAVRVAGPTIEGRYHHDGKVAGPTTLGRWLPDTVVSPTISKVAGKTIAKMSQSKHPKRSLTPRYCFLRGSMICPCDGQENRGWNQGK